jgi:hypothetical protein
MCFRMKTLALLFVLLALPFATISAQDIAVFEGTLIESAEVSGLPFDQLSPGLRQDIKSLGGQRVSSAVIAELTGRIEAERPDVVAAVRGVPRPDGNVRLIFLVARINDDRDLLSNINARYTIEAVEIAGIPESKVSQALRDDLHALAGQRFDPDQADRLEERLEAELPNFEVRRRIARGTQSGQIRLIFDVSEVEPPPPIPFTPSRSKLVYHSDMGWSGLLDIPMGGRHHRVTLGFAFDNDDDLIEEYSGYGLRFESRKVGTERVGVRLDFSSFRQSWREITLTEVESDPHIPDAYRTRITLEPAATFAITQHVRVTAGVSFSELESLSRAPESQMASAVVAAIGYTSGSDPRTNKGSKPRSTYEASYELRSATPALDSDLDYRRHFARAHYQYLHRNSGIVAGFFLGRINGRAPLFERFSLGDSSTLRGWNRFDVAPAGGDRVFHHSLEFRYHGLAFFMDGGSVWDEGTENRIRFSTGVGFHHDNVFVTVGVPLNADEAGARFLMGVRF